MKSSDEGEILWRPRGDEISATQYAKFVDEIGLFPELDDRNALNVYRLLHQWSVEHPGAFWRGIWRFSGLLGNLGDSDFVASSPIWARPFFPEGELSFAENVLQVNRCQDERFANSTALITIDEAGETQTISRGELLEKVLRFTRYLRQVGVGKGDRVAALLPNRAEAVIGLLATSACGAIWSCCSPDFGDDALLDRFSQIRPKLFLSATRSRYAGKSIELERRVCQLLEKLPSVEQWVSVGSPQFEAPDRIVRQVWSDIDALEAVPVPFERFPFNQPLYILYSSGTTGKPKCIVHGAGGSLLQHVKEHRLHLNMTSQDSVLYYTSTGWMMWNWLVSALASTETIVLYDGSPIAPQLGTLWQAGEQCKVTHFGASARYFAAIEKEGYIPKAEHDLSRIRCVMSTGSPLLPDQFGWLYQNVGSNIQLASISGGTDIVSCFVLGNPTLPIHAGEIQCRGLGMDVRVWDAQGNDLIEQPGELVCANAFPSMPVGFWGDEDGSRFRSAYFSRYENAWWHGDWVKESKHGGFVIYGRSDATLNPGGVRIGTGEIYQQVAAFEELSESVATVLRRDGDEKIVLFVKLQTGNTLTEELIDKIKSRLRTHCSPRHVPAYIVSAPDFPRTLSGKISEIAVRNALLGCDIGNVGALANPECLRFFSTWAKQV
jgi:acetoacetyl-CoA synthetase